MVVTLSGKGRKYLTQMRLHYTALSQALRTPFARLRSGPQSGEMDESTAAEAPAPIVAQKAESAHPQPAAWHRRSFHHLLVAGARIGFVGAVVLGMWWSWPDDIGPARIRSERAPATPVQSVELTGTGSLAIVNPANVAGWHAAPSPTTSDPASAKQPGQEATAIAPTPTPAEDDILLPTIIPLPTEAPDGRGSLAFVVDVPTAVAYLKDVTADQTNGVQASVLQPSVNAQDGQILLEPLPTRTPTAVPTPRVPLIRILPAENLKLSPTPPPATATSVSSPTPTATPIRLAAGRLWSNFLPREEEANHFWIERPFAAGVAGQLASPNYQFGSTAGNRYRTHHGLDISNPQGTPIRAAVSGQVVHAGWDDPALLGPYNGFYGNAVVIRLDRPLPVAGGQLDVYLLYGHLSEVLVQSGQRVEPNDTVGRVGMTGIAIGPHLHVEVRLGANSYEHSVNPYLWLKPVGKGGAVAVRLLTADGRTWAGARLTLARFENGKAVWARPIETYLDVENIGPDPAWGENGAMGSVPAGYYVIVGSVNGESVRADIQVKEGATTFVEIRTGQ